MQVFLLFRHAWQDDFSEARNACAEHASGDWILWLDAGEDAEEQWTGYDGNNELRFLNHAQQPNGEMDELDLYANRDIRSGEEITIDYGEEFTADA